MEDEFKIVDFYTYCDTCKYKNNPEVDEPCNDCLTIPARSHSHKPEYYNGNEE